MTTYKIGQEIHILVVQPGADFGRACDEARVKALRIFMGRDLFDEDPTILHSVPDVGDSNYIVEVLFESYDLTVRKDRSQRHNFRFKARVRVG